MFERTKNSVLIEYRSASTGSALQHQRIVRARAGGAPSESVGRRPTRPPRRLHLHRGPLQFPERSFWPLAPEDRSGLSRRGRVTAVPGARTVASDGSTTASSRRRARTASPSSAPRSRRWSARNPVEVQGSSGIGRDAPTASRPSWAATSRAPASSRRHRARPCSRLNGELPAGRRRKLNEEQHPVVQERPDRERGHLAPRERHGRHRERVLRRRFHHPPQPTRRGASRSRDENLAHRHRTRARRRRRSRRLPLRRRPARAQAPET